jgi:hypothetical protein
LNMIDRKFKTGQPLTRVLQNGGLSDKLKFCAS